MNIIPLSHSLIFSSILFTIGLIGLIIRKNLLFILISLEIMINSSALSFVMSGNYWNNPNGQIMYILIITVAAAEISVSLALLLQLYRCYNTLNINIIKEMNG